LFASCATKLGVYPASEDFTQELSGIVGELKERTPFLFQKMKWGLTIMALG